MQDDKRFSFSPDGYVACDLAIYKCAVNINFFGQKLYNLNDSITMLTIVVLSVDSHC